MTFEQKYGGALYSKSFWEQVLKDYSPRSNVYICHASDSFKREWNSVEHDSIIYFRKGCRRVCEQLGLAIPVSYICSALIMDGPYGPEFEPRLEFINHMISISTEP